MPLGVQEKCNRKSTSMDASHKEHGRHCQYPVMKLSNAISYSELFYKHLTYLACHILYSIYRLCKKHDVQGHPTGSQMRGTFGEYCTRGMRTIRRCSFLSCSPATLPLICCIHHLHQQPSRPAPGLLRSLLCLESHWTYEAVPHFDVNGIALVVSRCILLCSQLVVRPNWTRSDHRVPVVPHEAVPEVSKK